MHIVWFKKDLRLYDHEALLKASNCGPVLLIYILEPDLWQQSDMSYRHYRFLNDCLGELDQECNGIGHQLVIKVGDAVEEGDEIMVLEAMKMESPITAKRSGIVERINVAQGDQVTAGQTLFAIRG